MKSSKINGFWYLSSNLPLDSTILDIAKDIEIWLDNEMPKQGARKQLPCFLFAQLISSLARIFQPIGFTLVSNACGIFYPRFFRQQYNSYAVA